MSSERPEKIFVLAEEFVKQECLRKAELWHTEKNQMLFESGQQNRTARYAVAAVAEYIANEKGFTLYECNAKYPKIKKGDV